MGTSVNLERNSRDPRQARGGEIYKDEGLTRLNGHLTSHQAAFETAVFHEHAA